MPLQTNVTRKSLWLLVTILCIAFCSHAQDVTVVNRSPDITPTNFTGAPQDTFINILFAFDSYGLDAAAKLQLDQAYNRLIKNDSFRIYSLDIWGFTDYKGSEKYNYTLSKNRADAVSKYLVAISGDSILSKIGVSEHITACHGTKVNKGRREIWPHLVYWGKGADTIQLSHTDSLQIADSSFRAHSRRVMLHFQDGRPFCLGSFFICALPEKEQVFARDSTMKVIMPAGYLDNYLSGTDVAECRYANAEVTMQLTDSFLKDEELCRKISDVYKAKRPAPDIKVGTVHFTVTVKGVERFVPVCGHSFNVAHPLKTMFAASLIPYKDFVLCNAQHVPLKYTVEGRFIVVDIDTGIVQTIDVYIKTKAFTRVKLTTRGPFDFDVTEKEPLQQCDIVFDKTENKRTLFVKRTSFTVIKFPKQDNMIYMLNEKSNHTISTNLNTLKYDEKKKAYILKRKVLKKMQQQGT